MMKNLPDNIRKGLFFIIIAVLIIPWLQSKFHLIKVTPLKGMIAQTGKKEFSLKDWFSGSYQNEEEKYINENFGFRSLFVRINNQIAFSIFNKAKANGVIIGKNNYLFEENYIRAYYGQDFIGIDSIRERINKLKFIGDTLNKLNKNLILVFAAGKGSFYPEYFPDEFKAAKGKTNYEYYVKMAGEAGLNYIDFNRYFIEHKNNSKYPLYPQYGIHWSKYGMCLAADSMIRYIEQLRNVKMPHIYWNKIDLDEPRESDYDIADGMNIKFRLKSFQMAYPEVLVQSVEGKIKPSILVVSDSYYWGIFDLGFTRAFSLNHFWFYNKQVYPEYYQNGLETSAVSLKDEIEKHDVIMIMGTEATLPRFGWGFIENLYNHFKEIRVNDRAVPEFTRKVNELRNYIKTDKNWLEKIKDKARQRNISVDSMITIDAIWQVRNNK